MDGGGGGCGGGDGVGWWCMRGYAGMQDKTVMNRILLRFRPIAPKPVTGDADYTKSLVVSKAIAKRKYVRVNRNRGNRKTRKNLIGSDGGRNDNKNIVTLQLLPEKDHGEEKVDQTAVVSPEMKNSFSSIHEIADSGFLDVTAAAMSSMTVESVTDRSMEVGGFGRTDKERKKNLEEDMCPGFISDGLNRVEWVNEAYKGMVKGNKVISLVMKEKLPYEYGAFTCRVKVKYSYGKMKFSQMVPCDVWRMDNGGFAWRLDVNAALSLGQALRF